MSDIETHEKHHDSTSHEEEIVKTTFLTRLAQTSGFAYLVALIIAALTMFGSIYLGNAPGIVVLVFSIMAGLAVIFMYASASLETDLIGLGWLVGSAYGAFQGHPWISLTVGLVTAILGYIVVLECKNLSQVNKFFTEVRMNEYKALETGGMLYMFIGYAMRWFNKETNSYVSSKHKDHTSILAPYVPHPKTGQITRLKEGGVFTNGMRGVNYYLAKRLGIMYIGLAGIITVKKYDLVYYAVEHGEVVKKEYKKDKAVDTIFDSYTYMFSAHNLETDGIVSGIFIESLMLLYADNLFTICYEALPAGSWIYRADELYVDRARSHAAITDYKDILKERSAGDVELPPTKDELRLLNEAKKTATETIYTVMEQSNDEFRRTTGHTIGHLMISDIGVEGNPEFKKAAQKKKITMLEQEAVLAGEVIQTGIEAEKVKQALHKKDQDKHARAAVTETDEEYVKKVIKPVMENPNAMKLLQVMHLSRMTNLKAIGTETSMMITDDGSSPTKPKEKNNSNKPKNEDDPEKKKPEDDSEKTQGGH